MFNPRRLVTRLRKNRSRSGLGVTTNNACGRSRIGLLVTLYQAIQVHRGLPRPDALLEADLHL
jgi:hypothetical protein